MPPTKHHITRYQRWLRDTRGLSFDSYDALWRWSVSDLPAFWALDLGLLRPAVADAVRVRAARAGDARRGVVPRRAAQLRAAPVQPCRRQPCGRPPGHRVLRRSAAGARRAARAELARAAPPGGRLRGGLQGAWACSAATASAPSCPTCPRPSSSSWPAPAWARSGRCARPTWGRWRCSTASARSSPSCWWPATATATAAPRTTGARCSAQLLAELPSVRARGAVAQPRPATPTWPGRAAQAHDLAALLAGDAPFAPEWLPFDHPLWVVYSSGTTGLPKPIVHGHGGVMLEALKMGALHNDVGPSVDGRRPLPLVFQHRLDHVEQPARRAARRHHHLHLRRQPGGPAGRAGLEHAVALCRAGALQLLRCRRGLLCVAA